MMTKSVHGRPVNGSAATSSPGNGSTDADHPRDPERFDTIVIGGGQAGLAVGYYLDQHGRDFVILDANERIGDAWRKRWDSLRMFTPARYDGLPGLPFPAPAH